MEFNTPKWDISPFFPLAGKQPTVKFKDPKNRTLFSELNNHKDLAFIPPQGFIIADADNETAVENINKLNALLGIKPMWYPTTRGRHYIYRKPEGQFFERICSQNGGTAFIGKVSGKSYIDLKSSGIKDGEEKNGYVQVKRNDQWRVDPQALMDAFNEDTPILPFMLAVPIGFKFSLEEYIDGPRDDYLFRKVAKFRAKRWKKEDFIKFAVELKLMANDPETIDDTHSWASQKWESSEEMGDVVDNMVEKPSWDQLVADRAGMIPTPTVEETVDKEAKKAKKKAKKKEEPMPTGNHKFKFLRWSRPDDKNDKLYLGIDIKDIAGLTECLIRELKLQYSAEDDQIWGMQLGEFRPIKDMKLLVKRWLYENFGNIKPGIMNTVISFIDGAIPVKKFSEEKFYVSFKNKTLDLLNMKEASLNGDEMSQNLIPHDLINETNLKTTHKEHAEFLDKTMSSWTMNNKQLTQQLYERVGLALTKYMGHEKAYFLLGTGSNGKSIFLNLLVKALGPINVSQEDLKDLSSDQFSSSNLYGKLANVNFDISAEIIQDPSLFKKIVSGDRISASFKSKNKFSFAPYSTQFFGCNNVPYANEKGDSDAINRRMEILPFLAVFDKDNMTDREIIDFKNMMDDNKTVEVFIYNSIMAVNKALNNKFTTSKISANLLEATMKEMNHLYNFVEESGVKQNESMLETHKRYVTWAKQYNHKYYAILEFGKKYVNVARHYGIIIHRETFTGDTPERHRFMAEYRREPE